MPSPTPLTPERIHALMDICIETAKTSAGLGEIPVGALIWKDGAIISKAHNEVEKRSDPTAHAEILAIREAAKTLGNWRLDNCVLCVTLEPCPMCAGAIVQSRIPIVVFGAEDPKAGAFGSLFDLSSLYPLRIISKIHNQRCLALLQHFFASVRHQL